MSQTPVLFCDDGSEIALPVKWVICSACQGDGKTSAHLGAFTQSEMNEQGPEFFDDYIGGVYDKACGSCDGTGKRAIADTTKMTRAQRTEYTAQCRADRECASEEALERAMGC